MIYETAYVLRTDATDEAVSKLADVVAKTVADFDGEVLFTDDWGVKTMAQPTGKGIAKGRYVYVIFKANNTCNTELERRFKISEDVLKFIVVKLGEETEKEAILKAYVSPNASSGESSFDAAKERKMFSKRKSCWFSAKKTQPDWKNPATYSWLVNEFGKISPARVTGLRPKYQRLATAAIKRGRNMGVISHMSNDTFR